MLTVYRGRSWRPDVYKRQGYDITPLKFAQSLAALADMGVKVFGGCCGTTPKYIALLTLSLIHILDSWEEAAVKKPLCQRKTPPPRSSRRTAARERYLPCLLYTSRCV